MRATGWEAQKDYDTKTIFMLILRHYLPLSCSNLHCWYKCNGGKSCNFLARIKAMAQNCTAIFFMIYLQNFKQRSSLQDLHEVVKITLLISAFDYLFNILCDKMRGIEPWSDGSVGVSYDMLKLWFDPWSGHI